MMATAQEHLISATDLTVPVLSTDLPDHKGIWVGVAGSLDVITMGGQARTIVGISSGTLLPLRVKQITGGTASSLLLWF